MAFGMCWDEAVLEKMNVEGTEAVALATRAACGGGVSLQEKD